MPELLFALRDRLQGLLRWLCDPQGVLRRVLEVLGLLLELRGLQGLLHRVRFRCRLPVLRVSDPKC